MTGRMWVFSGLVLAATQNPLIGPFGAPSPQGRRDNNQPLSQRERVAEGRVRG